MNPLAPDIGRRVSRAVALPVAAILLCAATAGHAAEPVATGYNVASCRAESLGLGEGRSYTQFVGNGIMLSVEGQPNHMANFTCMGSFETFPDETFKVSGNCHHTDRDGEWWTARFWNDSSMDRGRWEITGGGGKWQGAKGAGTFVSNDRSTGSDCWAADYWEAETYPFHY